jgi:hypothetical protein
MASQRVVNLPPRGILERTNMNTTVNGIDVSALRQFAQQVAADPAKGIVRFSVGTKWEHQTRTVATVRHYELGGERHTRHFEIAADEPAELLGKDTAPNPQTCADFLGSTIA